MQKALKSLLKPVYLKHQPNQKSFPDDKYREEPELLLYAYFVDFFVDKLHSDNSWLVDRLADFSQEIDDLKRNKVSAESILKREVERLVEAEEPVIDQYSRALRGLRMAAI